jgi:2-oxoglutarate ferredoxin oxidoreductase subunit delta
MKEIEIYFDKDSCKHCGICVELCPKNVFGTDNMGLPYIKDGNLCTKCLFCELHCPEYAIEVLRGEIENNE